MAQLVGEQLLAAVIEKSPVFTESVTQQENSKILFESGIDKETPMISVDYGNKSNYMYGDTTVISSFAEGKNTVEIYRDDVLIETITALAEAGKSVRREDKKRLAMLDQTAKAE